MILSTREVAGASSRSLPKGGEDAGSGRSEDKGARA